MPSLKNYHILISHSWNYSMHYSMVRDWLNDAKFFTWSDYSVCCDNPLEVNDQFELREKLTNRISLASCIIVLAGMYASYSKWIDFEINTAKSRIKPIIAVKPWGQEKVPIKIQNECSILVGWNSMSVIQAVRDNGL